MMRIKSMLVMLLLLAFTLGYGILATTARHNAQQSSSVAPALVQARKIYASDGVQAGQQRPQLLRHYTRETPATVHPVLRWSRIDGAVMYDVQVLDWHEPEDGEAEGWYEPIMDSWRAYTNGAELALPDDFSGDHFYYRVAGLGVDGQLVGDYSEIEEVPVSHQPFIEKPELLSYYNQGNGEVLLYPVYDWLAVPDAAQYEVEVLDGPPENPNGISASAHRIDVYRTEYAQQYDPKPRYGEKPFYWRVRALTDTGAPLGVWSDAQMFMTNPSDDYVVATFGDSISHGGGSISYSPTDWDFSYQHYLDFPSVNLAQSGDTSTMTKERFERDVLPFHPQYLIILMGSNSLRNGFGASVVIDDMEAVRKDCLQHGIKPVFLTVPPFNPENIEKTFESETTPDWEFQVGRVNHYVRSQVHIDITPGMYDEKGCLRTDLSLDGLHLDPPGKQMMAAAINAAWPDIEALPDRTWDEE